MLEFQLLSKVQPPLYDDVNRSFIVITVNNLNSAAVLF